MPRYTSEACEEMRKLILDSKAHGEALSQEFDGGRSKEQIGSKPIISSIALLLSKLQHTGIKRDVSPASTNSPPPPPCLSLPSMPRLFLLNFTTAFPFVPVVSPIISSPACSSCNSNQSPFASFSSVNFDFYLITCAATNGFFFNVFFLARYSHFD
jgi:hypothetical protein